MTDGDIVMNRKPPHELVQICISFILVDFFYGSKDSTDNDPGLAYEWRGRMFDRVIFLKDLALLIHAHHRDTQAFGNQVPVPAKLPVTSVTPSSLALSKV